MILTFCADLFAVSVVDPGRVLRCRSSLFTPREETSCEYFVGLVFSGTYATIAPLRRKSESRGDVTSLPLKNAKIEFGGAASAAMRRWS